jgi:hypothetical protein
MSRLSACQEKFIVILRERWRRRISYVLPLPLWEMGKKKKEIKKPPPEMEGVFSFLQASLFAGELVALARELDVCRVVAPRRGDGMHASALRALANEGLQDKGLSAALALGVKSAVRDGGVPHSAVVRAIDELYQLNAF